MAGEEEGKAVTTGDFSVVFAIWFAFAGLGAYGASAVAVCVVLPLGRIASHDPHARPGAPHGQPSRTRARCRTNPPVPGAG